MKKICISILGLLLTQSAWADISIDPLVNKVSLQLHAEQWVTTKTALVSVSVNAAVSDQGIEGVQNDVIQKLNQLSNKGEWHIVSFDRQLDKSGLESIQILAQARLPQTELGNLRDKARSISKPGETFMINNVQFIPSDEEIKQSNWILRNNIYQQVKAEIDAINKIYPEQKFYLHRIDFMLSPPPMEPMPMVSNAMMMAKVAGSPMPPQLSVGNKVELQANVTLGSMSEQLTQKLTHT